MAAKKKNRIPVGYADIEQFASIPGVVEGQAAIAATPEWELIFKNNFPAFAYLLSPDNPLGSEAFAIMRQAAEEEWFNNPDSGAAKLKAAIENTNYYKTTSTASMEFDSFKDVDKQELIAKNKALLVSQYGNLGLDDAQLTEVSRAITRQGLTGAAAKNFYIGYSATISKMGSTGMAPSQAVMQTSDAEKVRSKAKDYFQAATDQDILDVTTGKKTLDDFETQLKARSVALFPHLKDAIDAGNTLESLASVYKRDAATILEKDETQIDFSDSMFQEALAKRQPDGSVKQQTLTEWRDSLKTDRRYGYQYTKAANRNARNLARSIIEGFGGY